MKKRLIFVLLITFPCLAQIQNQQQSQHNAELEKYISRLRAEVEANAELQIIQVNQQTQAQIELLEFPDRQIYSNLSAQAEIAKTVLNLNNPSPWDLDNFINSTDFVMEYELDSLDPLKASRFHQRPRSVRMAAKAFAKFQNEIIAMKNQIEKKRDWEILNIQRQRDYAINVSIPHLEQKLKNNQLQAQTAPTHGLITAIMISEDKTSAVINGQIAHNNDIIDGVRINKIYSDKIEFEKNGTKWEQKVQQNPSDNWK
ncbi:MAG: hypothetical protein ABFD79_11585 [Phycisphaerales bacterium]